MKTEFNKVFKKQYDYITYKITLMIKILLDIIEFYNCQFTLILIYLPTTYFIF